MYAQFPLAGLRRWVSRHRIIPAVLVFGPHAGVVQYLVNRHACHAKRVLDLGARRSPYTGALRGQVVAVDLPRTVGADLGLGTRIDSRPDRGTLLPVYGSGDALPFCDQAFDVVLMIEVLEHIEQDERCVAEVARVLRPGGVLLLCTPDGDTFPTPSPRHCRHYRHQDLRRLVGKWLQVKKLWRLFPSGYLWAESVRSVRAMVQNRRWASLTRHIFLVWIYWLVVLFHAALGRSYGSTTIFVLATRAGDPHDV